MSPGTFRAYLEARGLSARTVGAYVQVVGMAETEGLDPVDWLAKKVTASTPRTSITVYRAAVSAHARWMQAATGAPSDDAFELQLRRSLVSARKGRQGEERDAPTPAQYALWRERLKRIDDPEHTVLQLLPYTGLRVSEACGLKLDDVLRLDGRTILRVLGKGNKLRTVPLGAAAEKLLADFIEREKPEPPWVFWRAVTPGVPVPRPLRGYEVDRAAAAVRGDDERLAGIVPHSMRHLYATTALRAGVAPRTVQLYLGHADIATTMRYTHPDVQLMAEGADAVGDLLARLVDKDATVR